MTIVRRVIENRDTGVMRVLREIEDVAFIAGGAARSMIEPTAPDHSDIDVYLRTADEDGSARALIAASLAGLQYTELGRAGMSVVYGTTRRMTKPVQVIQPARNGEHVTYGTPEEVIDGFSFTVEQYAIDLVDGDLTAIFTEDAEVAHREHRIRLHRVHNPVSSAYRLQKYGGKGYRASMDEVVKLFRAWEALSAEQRDAIAAIEWLEIAPEVVQAMGDPDIAQAYGEIGEGAETLMYAQAALGTATQLIQDMGGPAPGGLTTTLEPAMETVNLRIREQLNRRVPNWVDVPRAQGDYYTPWQREDTQRAWTRMAGRQLQRITDREIAVAPAELLTDNDEFTLNRVGYHLHGWPIDPPRAPVHDPRNRVVFPRVRALNMVGDTPLAADVDYLGAFDAFAADTGQPMPAPHDPRTPPTIT